jgi:anaerobic magnesium-protoporphyrin IX monomethyl ester cyclase
MKITLISTIIELQDMGIRILSSYLKKKGHDVRVIFLLRKVGEVLDANQLKNLVNLVKGSELLGISVMTNFFDVAVQVTKSLKESLNIPVIWGGAHPSLRPLECLDYADMVCIGEGHETIVELAEKTEMGKTCYDIEGLWFKANGRVIKNRYRTPCQDLNSMPLQDYEYENQYVLSNEKFIKLNKDYYKKYKGDYGFYYYAMASTGCPLDCAYCNNRALRKIYQGSKIVKKRDLHNVIDEFLAAKKNLLFLKGFWIIDENFINNFTVDEIRSFSKKYKENIRLPLRVTGVPPAIDNGEKLSLLADAGMEMIRTGIETASENTKKLYKRNFSNKELKKMAFILNDLRKTTGLSEIRYDIILDNPWETEKDLVETLMFLSGVPVPYRLMLFSLTFYPDTELYKKAKKEGMISDEHKDVYNKYIMGVKETYLNNVFKLLGMYAFAGKRIKPTIMFLLTNRYMRHSGFSKCLYKILNNRRLK